MEPVQDDNIGNDKKRKPTSDGYSIREAKQRKWEAKQRRKEEQAVTERDRAIWFDKHSQFASLVTEKDIQTFDGTGLSSTGRISEDLAPYFNIQETQRELNKNEAGGFGSLSRSPSITSNERLFIAEGTETVRMLIRQYAQRNNKLQDLGLRRVQLKSIFVKPQLLFEEPVKLISDVNDVLEKDGASNDSSSLGFRVLVGKSDTVLSKIAGFPISRGALACGIVPNDRDEEWLDAYLHKKLQSTSSSLRLLALDGICDTANLGSMIRTSSAFGIHAVVLSNDSCDAWYRRSIRVSMGHVFLLPIVRVRSLAAFLAKWNSNGSKSFTTFGAVVQSEDTVLDCVPHGDIPSAWCCVMGNEGNGIKKEVLERCTLRIRIDMVDGVDSLSLPIACGILLHGLRERESSAKKLFEQIDFSK
jgi:tRNA G18 (ribose-2'-O)-methylase SpoU